MPCIEWNRCDCCEPKNFEHFKNYEEEEEEEKMDVFKTYEYLSMPSSLFVQTMTHLSEPPDANFFPSNA